MTADLGGESLDALVHAVITADWDGASPVLNELGRRAMEGDKGAISALIEGLNRLPEEASYEVVAEWEYIVAMLERVGPAAVHRGTARRLPHSRLWLIAVSTWGEARQRLGNWHPYALVYWPGSRPVWLILVDSPALMSGTEVKVRCQR